MIQNDSHFFVAAIGLDIYEKQTRSIAASLYKGEYVASCALSPDGNQVCVALSDHLAFHSTIDYSLIETLPLTIVPADLAWSPDASSIAILSDHGTLALLNIEEGRLVWSQSIASSSGLSSVVDNLMFCNDGRYLVYKANSFGIVRVSDGERLLHNDDPLNLLAPFDVDTTFNQIVVAMDFEMIHVLEIENDRVDTVAVIRFRGDRITALLLDGSNSEVVVAQSDRVERISSLDGESVIRRAVPGYEIQNLVSLGPGHLLLIDALPSHAWIIDSDSLVTIETFASYSHVVNQLAWNQSGSLLAGADSRTFVIHDAEYGENGAPISTNISHAIWDIRDVEFSTDGRFLGVVTNKRLMLWDIYEGFAQVQVGLVPLDRFYQFKWIPAKHSFVVTSDSATYICDIINDDISSVSISEMPVTLGGLDVSVRDLRAFAIDTSGVLVDVSLVDGTIRERIEEIELEGLLVDLCVDDYDRFVVMVERSGKVSVWDNVAQRVHQTFTHQGGIIASELVPESSLLVTSGYDYRLLVWDLQSGDVVHVIERPKRGTSIACSRDGTRLAVGYEDGLIVYHAPWSLVDVPLTNPSLESIQSVQLVTGDTWRVRMPFDGSTGQVVSVEVSDVAGRISPSSFEYRNQEDVVIIETSLLQPGFYWVSVELEGERFVVPIILGSAL